MKSLPRWFRKDIPDITLIKERLNLFKDLDLHTVCASAHCPNMGECFSKGTATFMILGDICTRNCRFCAVSKGNPLPLDFNEPENIAQAIKNLNLDYAVITSVTRDDLSDGGALQYYKAIDEIRKVNPETKIEILIPDFQGQQESIEVVVNAHPDVIGHNVETVPRLYKKVSPQADYELSLGVLKKIKEKNNFIFTKSTILLGLGETKQEIIQTMKDLNNVGCDMLAIGQYLSPSQDHLGVQRYFSPDEFGEFQDIGSSLGFKSVASGPFVRSSYNASEELSGCTM
ncbi:MAG: lipoyl synthase [Candidatus Omnitrophota bacterium]